MGLDAGIRQAILSGRPPQPAELDGLVATEAVRLGSAGAGEVRAALGAALLGAGPLEPLLAAPGVTDVLVNGDGSVWVDRGSGLERAEAELLPAETSRQLAVRLAGQAGRRLDESQPWVDGLLPGGVRVMSSGCAPESSSAFARPCFASRLKTCGDGSCSASEVLSRGASPFASRVKSSRRWVSS